MCQAEVPLMALGEAGGGLGEEERRLAVEDVMPIPGSSGAGVKALGTDWVEYMTILGPGACLKPTFQDVLGVPMGVGY